MCGITGAYIFKQSAATVLDKVTTSCQQLSKRGPDNQGEFKNERLALGHRRLSIIDTSSSANQPFKDPTGRYILVFNGEIFNYQELARKYLTNSSDQPHLQTHSDTEVLLHLLIRYGVECLNWLSGFFAFAFYDTQSEKLTLGRDRFGKKPLLYYFNEDYFVFASEMKSLLGYGIPKKLDYSSLAQYLQLNYVPQPATILKDVSKVRPGHVIEISPDHSTKSYPYYKSSERLHGLHSSMGYDDAKKMLDEKLDDAVKRRLIADVPLGAFLSGGIDSSVVVALTSRHVDKLNTFSIGYADHPYFDETSYAELVAKKFNTAHTVFSLRNQDVSENIFDVLDYMDEPFADSSAIPVYILCKNVSKHVKVALSGDGGDEVFAGYNKHKAELKVRNGGSLQSLLGAALPILNQLPKSRRNKITNIFRQAHRYAHGATLDPKSRYWLWASFLPEPKAFQLLSEQSRQALHSSQYETTKQEILSTVEDKKTMEDMLITDINLALIGDMFVKVDMMSMANSLEVRSPFMDHEVVEFAFSLPTAYKIDNTITKKIVQDTFRDILPPELYNRPKRGFEIPLLDFLKTEFKDIINNKLLNADFVREQGIFDPSVTEYYRKKLFSVNPEDSSTTIWNLVVFQYWYTKYFAD